MSNQNFLAELEVFRAPDRNKSFILSKNKLNKWTLNLFLCCLTISSAGFQFGYNISSLNMATNTLKSFIRNDSYFFEDYMERMEKLNSMEIALIEGTDNETSTTNSSIHDNSLVAKYRFNFKELSEMKKLSKLIRVRARKENTEAKIRTRVEIIWAFINCLFIFGGMLGSFVSKYVLEIAGRKNGFVFQNFFSILGSVFSFISLLINSTFCIVFSRFLFGIQSGMGNSIAAVYASEIAPNRLRGSVGVLNQLVTTFGIAFAQFLGFSQLLGNEKYWHLYLSFPFVIAVSGSLLIQFFPESPKVLLLKHDDYDRAIKALRFLRHDLDDVIEEIDGLRDELEQPTESISIWALLGSKELRWPLITSIVLITGMQLSGIKAIFFYSASTFREAGVQEDYIQYAIFCTGVVYSIGTLICIPLVDRVGRRFLLLPTIFLMIINYMAITVILTLEKNHNFYSSNAIVACIMLYLFLFSIALSPIPFPYAAECFRQNSRATALAIGGVLSWISSLLVTLFFPLLEQLIDQYVFLVFAAFLALVFFTVLIKVPETKGKSAEEIIAIFQK